MSSILPSFLLTYLCFLRSTGNMTAMLHLLMRLLKVHSWTLPRIVPFLLDFAENPPPSKGMGNAFQLRNVLYTLKTYLSILLTKSLPMTSRIYASLIDPILNDLNDKMRQDGLHASTRTNGKRGGGGGGMRKIKNEYSISTTSITTTTTSPTFTVTEEIDRLVRRHMTILTNKQQTTIPFDLTRLSMRWIVEVIVGSLLSFSLQDLDESVKVNEE